MSSRKPGYVISVVLTALVLSAPQVIGVSAIGYAWIESGQFPLPAIPGFAETENHLPIHVLPFWRNKFVHVCDWETNPEGIDEQRIALIDPETGDVEKLKPIIRGNGAFQAIVIGDRLWFVDANGIDQSYELVDGVLSRSDFAYTNWQYSGRQLFLLDNIPSVIESTANGCEVSQFRNAGWSSIGILARPPKELGWAVSDLMMTGGSSATCQVFDSREGIHLFLRSDEYLFHHLGLEIVPIPTFPQEDVDGTNETEAMPVSTLQPQNVEVDLRGWSFVRHQPVTNGPDEISQVLHGLLIGGKPVALIVDDVESGNAIGRLYRLDGTTWSEFASMPFPFGSTSFVVVTSQEGERSYVGVRTSCGVSYVYALEATGFRETAGSAAVKTGDFDSTVSPVFDLVDIYFAILIISTTLGIVVGLLTWPMMRWFTTSDYGFGAHSVKLASLGYRGCARLIDMGFIGGSASLLGWLMTRGVDWYAFFEALNLHADHPSIQSAQRATMIVAAWLIGIGFVLLMSQASWGITPGKWLCGLRTVRTSLRQCGFARSIAREIVFFVDTCNLLCWTPGIVSIAFTDRRQRLGDLVADTIVVEARSLVANSKAQNNFAADE